jgi:hypothetical protein
MHAWLLVAALISDCPMCPSHGPVERIQARKAYEYHYRIGCGSADRHCWSCQHGAWPYYDFRRELDYPWFSPSRPQLLELYPPARPAAEAEAVPPQPEPPATAPPQTTRRQAASRSRSRGTANPLRSGPTSD